LKLMGRSPGDRLTPEVTREVCERTGSKAMLTGTIASLGSQYVIGLKATSCSTGNTLAQAQEAAADKEQVLKALDKGAINTRRKLGESLSSLEKYATPLEEATTPSLEALKAYSMGWKAEYKNLRDGLPFHEKAVKLDPNFALAYAAMGGIYWSVGEVGRGAENMRRAYDLREKVTERERLWIEGWFYSLATGELEKAERTYEVWERIYPRDAIPPNMLGIISSSLGNHEKALQEYREALRLEPNSATNYANLAQIYLILNRLDEAEVVYKQAEGRNIEAEGILQNHYQLAFLKGNEMQMAQLAASALGKPRTEDMMIASEADTEGWHGKLKNANELTRRAMDSAKENDAKESAASYQALAAVRDVESVDRQQARREAYAAVQSAPNREVLPIAALALAVAGDAAGAESLAVELNKKFPLDTVVQRYWLPTIRAGVALERKDPNRTIEILKSVSSIELSGPTQFTIYLCPAYLRGAAYLKLHDGKAAAAEFQKFIDHRGLVVNFPWGALARLQLARANAMQGETAKAKSAYADFLTLWKDADPDIPILKQAKAEYAKLQ